MRKFLRILILVISIWVIIFCIDFICIRTIKRPIFMIKTNTYKDGGSTEYVGLFYKVIKCTTLDGDKTITLGTYSLKYSCQALTDSELGKSRAKAFADTFDELVSEELAKLIASAIDYYVKNISIFGTIITRIVLLVCGCIVLCVIKISIFYFLSINRSF